MTFIFVMLVLGWIAFLASYIPALRATRADPMIALSHST
jgi:ABC-type lipoprotein release transport system permease subunit